MLPSTGKTNPFLKSTRAYYVPSIIHDTKLILIVCALID